DLEEHALSGGECGVDRGPGRAIPVGVMHGGCLEHLPCLDQTIELLVADKVVVDALDFTRPWGASGRGDRQVNLRVVLTDVVRNGPLAHGGRAREHDEPAAGGAASVLFSLDRPV